MVRGDSDAPLDENEMERTIEAQVLRIGWKRRLRYLMWPPRERELSTAGRSGEMVIARARLAIVALLLLPNIATLLRDPKALSGWLGIATVVVCFAIGLEILRRAAADRMSKALPIFSTVLDVSIVSGYHVLLFAGGAWDVALESRATFAVYVIAIMGTALRYDGRLVRLAGLVAIVQYLAIIEWADATMRATAAAARFYGDTTLAGQSEEVSMLLVATVLGCIMVERARELRLSGIRDPLTRLPNRGYFSERMTTELVRASRMQRSAVVAMIDVDHFKKVNDTHGHAVGDLVLRHVAAQLRLAVRSEELVARVGGEEFAMLLFENSRDQAQDRLDRLRTALGSMVIQAKRAVAVRVTVSMGFAMAPEEGSEAMKLLELADERLLAGKRAGRDVVVAM
jgi:diguanylate cyclase (GGDEF)-like protein